MSLSLRLRLTLWFSLVMAVSLAVFGVLTYTSVSTELTSDLDVSLNEVVASVDRIIRIQAEDSKENSKKGEDEKETGSRKRQGTKQGTGSDNELAFLHPDSIAKDSTIKSAIRPLNEESGEKREPKPGEADPLWTAIYEQIILSPRNFIIQIMDSTGAIVYRSANLGDDTLQLPEPFVTLAQDSVANFVTADQMLRDGTEPKPFRVAIARSRKSVLIAAAYPINSVQMLLDNFFETLTLLIPVVLVFSTIGGWFLARASLHPVDEITRTAQDITASNLSRRLPVPSSDDEIRRLSDTLNDMISRLESSFERVRQFTADASHELRTPLTIMTGELELALRSRKTPEEYQDVLSSALQEVLRLSRVVEYLLLLSRADMAQIALHMEQTNLTEMLADLADAATILGAPKTIYITYRHSEDLYVEADHAKLYQMFLNLVDNAVKYTPEGGLISITLHRDGGFAEVRVRDTGIGISPENQKKIFDRFYRVDKARSRELGGAGLGLSIVQWTVQAHGGTIHVESEPGQGSTFCVRLPLMVEKPAATAEVGVEERKQRKSLYNFELGKLLKRAKPENGDSKKKEAK